MSTLSAEETEERRRAFQKLLLANQDALEAREYVRRAAAFRQRGSLTPEDKVALAAFVAAVVVAYGRCFVSSLSKRTNLPGFTERFLNTLSPAERTLHGRLLELRHQEFAHSDADAAAINVGVAEGPWLVPISRILRIHSLEPEQVADAARLVDKLIAFVTEELVLLQTTLAPAGSF